MALKVRQKKKNNASQQAHPSYTGTHGRHWAEEYREKNQGSFRKSFVAIIVVMVVIVAILIAGAVTAVVTPAVTSQQITAADTFAVSQMEQQQMSEDAQTFADGVLVWAYCSDRTTANQGKIAALDLISPASQTYEKIEGLSQVNPVIAPSNFVPIITEPVLQTTTQAYAGSFTYEFDGVAVDTSVVSDANPDGTFADAGYHFRVTFNYASDENDENHQWVITEAIITAK